jgi:DnaK suppressor protein
MARTSCSAPVVIGNREKNMLRKNAIESLRDILLRRREALRKALAGDLSLLKELAEQSQGDVVDFALDSSQDEITSQIAEVESRELANIDVALKRMREGTYGICDGCNRPIPMARLEALPYASCCIECQRELERGGQKGSSERGWRNVLDTGVSEADRSLADFEMDLS